MSGALAAAPVTVVAAAADGDQEPTAPMNRDELSLYTEPQRRLVYAEPEAGKVEQSVAAVRKLAQPYTSWCQGAYDGVKPKLQSIVELGNDTYAYSKAHPKDFYPRAVVIGLTGALGLYHARGSAVKKLVYPTGLMTLSASLYYPKQAAAIARSTGESVYDCAVQGYVAAERILKR